MRGLGAIIRKEFAHIRADPLMVRLIFAPVLIQLFVIGYALTTEVRHVPIGAVDHSRTPESAELLRAFAVGDRFDYLGAVSSERELRRLLDNGTLRMGIVVPAGFSRDLYRERPSTVHLLVDGQDANSSQVAAGYAHAIINRWTLAHLDGRLRARGMDLETLVPIDVPVTVLYNPLLKSSWYMLPGLVAVLVTIVTSLLAGLSLVREKERGTLEQLLVTPIRPVPLLLGKITPFVLIGLIEITVFLLLVTLWFGIPLRGGVFAVFAFSLIYMISSLGIGILISTLARTSQQVLFLTFFVMVFFMLLGGWMIPIDNMPRWVRTMTNVNPLRFFIAAVRAIFLKGLGVRELWREACTLLGIGLTVFTLALVSFRRRAR